MIDELSKLHTTQEIIRKYRHDYMGDYLSALIEDMQHCSRGNVLAIEACLGNELKMYQRDQPERPLDENKDIIGEMMGG